MKINFFIIENIMTKILFVENNTLQDNPMSSCYQLKCNKIMEMSDVSYFNISHDIDFEPSDYDILLLGCRAVPFYKKYRKPKIVNKITSNMDKLLRIQNRFMILQDMHSKTYGSLDILGEFLRTNKFKIIFTFFNCYEAKLIRRKTQGCTYYHLPHHIDTQKFRVRPEIEKEYDICLFGNAHPKHYPFRNRLFRIIRESELFNIKDIPYKPDEFNPETCEEGLSHILNACKLAISTKSKYNYYVGKYLEITLSDCLIVGDIPADGSHILKNNIVEIVDTMTDNEIIQIILDVLKNYDDQLYKIDNLQRFYNENFNLEQYIVKLRQIIY